ISSLVFNPFLRLAVTPRPFWTGHPLHWIREIVESIPVLVLPLPGVALGASALVAAALFNQRRGLALAATILGVCLYFRFGAVFVFIVATAGGLDWAVPGMRDKPDYESCSRSTVLSACDASFDPEGAGSLPLMTPFLMSSNCARTA